jgi:hypothetical protein
MQLRNPPAPTSWCAPFGLLRKPTSSRLIAADNHLSAPAGRSGGARRRGAAADRRLRQGPQGGRARRRGRGGGRRRAGGRRSPFLVLRLCEGPVPPSAAQLPGNRAAQMRQLLQPTLHAATAHPCCIANMARAGPGRQGAPDGAAGGPPRAGARLYRRRGPAVPGVRPVVHRAGRGQQAAVQLVLHAGGLGRAALRAGEPCSRWVCWRVGWLVGW